MKQSISVIALLLASSTQAVNLNQTESNLQGEQNKPGDSSNVDIDPESFAEASTNARIETDLEIAEGKSSENQNELWKKHFQSSEFYKNYQAHLQHRGEMTHIRSLNNQALSQIKNDYKSLQSKYNNLSQQAKQNWQLGKKLSQQVPGGEKLFADQQGPTSYENILLAEMVGDDEELIKKNDLETVEEQNSSLNLNKDPSNPFNVKQKDEKELVSSIVPEDSAPAEEKEKWFEKEPKVQDSHAKQAQDSHTNVGQASVKSQAAKATSIDDFPALEPVVIQVGDDKKVEAVIQPAASQAQQSEAAKEPMASAILNVMSAPVSKELIKIGEQPEAEIQEESPQDEQDIQIKGLPKSETTSATVTNRNWSVTVIKTEFPPITAPSGAVKVSDWATPIDDSPVLEPLDAAVMPVVKHDHIYDNFPQQPIKCSDLN